MPHIELSDRPGIRALFIFRPETAKPLCELADVLLHGPSSLRVASASSSRRSLHNACRYCTGSDSAYAAAQLPGGAAPVDDVKRDPATADISPKLRALLAIAAEVQQGGRSVPATTVTAAKALGATDLRSKILC